MLSLTSTWSIRPRLVYSAPHQPRLPLHYEYIEQRLQVWQALYSPEQFQGCAALPLREYCLSQASEFCLHVRIGERIVLVPFGIGRVRHQALTRYGGHLHATVVFLRKALREILVFVDSSSSQSGDAVPGPVHAQGEAGRCDSAIVERHGH